MSTRNQEIGANIQRRCQVRESSEKAMEGTCLRCAMRDVHNLCDCRSCPARKLYEMNQEYLPTLDEHRRGVTIRIIIDG